ncbi:MAG: hypothetical protein M3O15_05195, partial [Acidobacteriota bacterium]|nr:hypothetical protein [Acidobacteriota bacterium]
MANHARTLNRLGPIGTRLGQRAGKAHSRKEVREVKVEEKQEESPALQAGGALARRESTSLAGSRTAAAKRVVACNDLLNHLRALVHNRPVPMVVIAGATAGDATS